MKEIIYLFIGYNFRITYCEMDFLSKRSTINQNLEQLIVDIPSYILIMENLSDRSSDLNIKRVSKFTKIPIIVTAKCLGLAKMEYYMREQRVLIVQKQYKFFEQHQID